MPLQTEYCSISDGAAPEEEAGARDREDYAVYQRIITHTRARAHVHHIAQTSLHNCKARTASPPAYVSRRRRSSRILVRYCCAPCVFSSFSLPPLFVALRLRCTTGRRGLLGYQCASAIPSRLYTTAAVAAALSVSVSSKKLLLFFAKV